MNMDWLSRSSFIGVKEEFETAMMKDDWHGFPSNNFGVTVPD
jgi:hypothetical protein